MPLHGRGPSEAHGLARRQNPVAQPEGLERRLLLGQRPRRHYRRGGSVALPPIRAATDETAHVPGGEAGGLGGAETATVM